MKSIKKQIITYYFIYLSLIYIPTSIFTLNNKESNINSIRNEFTNRNSKSTQPDYVLASYNMKSNVSNYNVNNIHSIENLDVNCQDGILQGFRLIRTGYMGSQAQYEFSCRNMGLAGVESYTGKTQALDPRFYQPPNLLFNQTVKCKPGYALQGFKLMNNGPPYSKVFYQFKCVRLNLLNCRETYTSHVPTGNPFNLNSFFQIGFLVKRGQVITQFKYHFGWSIFLRVPVSVYIYSYCDLSKNPFKKVPVSKVVKSIKQNKKRTQQEGNRFCSTKCIPDLLSKGKKCWKNGVKHCNTCQYKDRRFIMDHKEEEAICKYACNAIKNSNNCEYYTFTNDKKKLLDPKVLNKYGVKLFKK